MSAESERLLQADLAKDVGRMRLAQGQPGMPDRDRTPTGSRGAAGGPDILPDHGGLTAFPNPQLGRQTSHDLAQEQMRRQMEQQNKGRLEEQQRQQLRSIQPPPGLGHQSRRPPGGALVPPQPPSHSSQLRNMPSTQTLQSGNDRRQSAPPPPPDHMPVNNNLPLENEGEVTALGGVILPALEAALTRRTYHLQQQSMRKGAKNQEKHQHAHDRLKRLVYKAAQVFKDIEEWDKAAPVGMGSEVSGFLEGFLEEVLVRVEAEEEEEALPVRHHPLQQHPQPQQHPQHRPMQPGQQRRW